MLNKLIEICGKVNVSEELLDKITYSYDASQKKGKDAIVIIWPEDDEQIRKIVMFCNRVNYNLIARGAGTNLTSAVIPNNSIIMDLSKLNKILEINLREKYAVAEAGVVLSQLNRALKRYSCMFPIIPRSHKVATVGGMIGADSVGKWSSKFGRMFDNIIELEVIDGTGKCFKTQRIRDFVGTEGALGIVTKAKLKITDEIKPKSMDLLSFEKTADAITKAKEFMGRDEILAVQYIDKAVAEISSIDKFHYLIIEYRSNEGSVKDPKDMKTIKDVQNNMFKKLMAEKYLFIETPFVPFDKMDDFLRLLRKNNTPVLSNIATGFNMLFFRETQLQEIDGLLEKIREFGGKPSMLGVGTKYKKYLSNDEINLIKSKKAKYDPNNILNKGKII